MHSGISLPYFSYLEFIVLLRLFSRFPKWKRNGEKEAPPGNDSSSSKIDACNMWDESQLKRDYLSFLARRELDDLLKLAEVHIPTIRDFSLISS